MGLTAFGMAEVMQAMGAWFEWLRWLGVTSLVYLGVKEWRAPLTDLTQT